MRRCPGCQGLPQFLDRLEVLHQEQPLLEGADGASRLFAENSIDPPAAAPPPPA